MSTKYCQLSIVNCRLRLVILISLITLFSNSLFGQDFKRDYRSAKEFYDDEKFNFAMDAFRPLMVYDKDNPFVEYATFYYALSAYHQNYLAVAKEALFQLKKLYPEWNQMDEVNYWLAAVYFKQGEAFQALRMLYEMQSPRDLASIDKMKNYYLAQIQDEEVVRLILEEFPGEQTLLKKLIARKLAKGDYDRALQLIEQFGLNQNDFHFPKARAVKKEKYRVGALFPFLTEILDPSPGNKFNQSALDLYQGMMLAGDSLRNVGVDIDLVAYDTERKPEKVEVLMKLDEMKSVDVLVGPLFSDELKPVAEFSKNNSIPVINTISNSAEFVKDNPNALLLQPDYSVIGMASAESISKRNLKRPCVVLYGDTPKDSIMAASFLKRAKELDLKIAFTRHIPHASTPDVYRALVNPTKYDKFRNPVEFQVKKDSIGSVFVASDNELIFTKVISSVDRRGDSVIVVGMDSWLDKPGMEFEKFERLHIMMSSPDYTNIHSPEYLEFRRKYMAKYGIIPSPFAKNGFESMMLIGVALKENGLNFIPKLQGENSTTGVLKRFYNFHNSQCNREVPFVFFSSGELRVLY